MILTPAKMTRREVIFFTFGLLLWSLMAAMMMHQYSAVKSIRQKQQQLDGENRLLKRERRGVGDTSISYSTEDCVNINCHGGGATYVRWGKLNCSGPDTELVYSGLVGGSLFSVHGGGANLICLSNEPQWGNVDTAFSNYSPLHGAEYQGSTNNQPFRRNPGGPSSLYNHDIPCSVCRAKSSISMVMIPGRRDCYPGWIREYRGYLMAGHRSHQGRNQFICVDEMPDAESSGYRDDNGALLYKVEAVCGSLPCPPYVAGNEISCVVCTK